MTPRVELNEGPDDRGRYLYTFVWTAAYHPGDPRGEYRVAERAQCFFGVPPPGVPVLDLRRTRIAL